MADKYTDLTNVRGPAARIVSADAVTLGAGEPATVEMTGPDQGRVFTFGVPMGLPGPGAVPADDAVAGYVALPSATRDALDGRYTPLPGMGRNALTGWVHLDGAGLSPSKTAAENASLLQAAFDAAGPKGTVYLSEAFGEGTIPVQAGVVTVTNNQVTLLGSVARSEFSPVLKGVGSGYMITVKGYGFNAQGVNFRGDGALVGGVWTTTVDGILLDRTDGSGNDILANLDGKVRDCGFLYLRQCVRAVGRNVDFVDNIFSNSIGGIQVARYLTTECRGFRFNGNRFHSIGIDQSTDLGGADAVCIDVDPASFNNQVINNYADMGTRRFFRGPVDRTQINNNDLTYVCGIGIEILNAAVAQLWQIVGNMFFGPITGITTQAQLDALKSTPDYFIYAAGTVTHGLIANNIIRLTRYHGISIATANAISVTGNTVIDSGMFHHLSDGQVSDGIYIGAGNGSLLVGNRIRNSSPGGSVSNRYGINVGTCVFTRVMGNYITEVSMAQINAPGANNQVDDDGYRRMTTRGASTVPNNSLFLDTDNVLKFRDNAGVLKTVTLT